MSRFCQSCGGALAQGASYCNRCGAGVSLPQKRGEGSRESSSADNLVWAAVGANITLLGMVLGGLVVLKDSGYTPDIIIGYMILCAVGLIVTDAILLWRLLRFNRRRPREEKQDPRATEAEEHDAFATNELDASHARALPEHMPSVTEDATRQFEPSYRKREK